MRRLNPALYAAIGLAFTQPVMSADWSYPLSYRLAIAANCAYEHSSGDALKCLNATPEFKDLTEDQIILRPDLGPENRDGYLLIHSSKPDLILAIRGTQPPADKNSTPKSIALDWLNDLVMGPLIPPAFEKDEYHAGFLRAWGNINDNLKTQTKAEKWLDEAKQGNSARPFYVTGHSKGAAIALLATDKICKASDQVALPMPTATYAFEPARSLTHKKASEDKACFDNTWRFEFGDDIVPHIPLTADAKGVHGKLLDIAYRFKDIVNSLPKLPHLPAVPKIPDYDSVGHLFYVDNDGTGKVIANPSDIFESRVKTLSKHLDDLELIIQKPTPRRVLPLVKALLQANDRQDARNKIKDFFIKQPLKLDENNRDQCRTQLSLIDDHIVYYQWLTKAVATSTATSEVTVKDDEIHTLAGCCGKQSVGEFQQCLTGTPDIKAIQNRQ